MHLSEMAYSILALVLMIVLDSTEGSIAGSLPRCYYSLGYRPFQGRRDTLYPFFMGSLFYFFSFFSVISLGKIFLYISLYVANLQSRKLLTAGDIESFIGNISYFASPPKISSLTFNLPPHAPLQIQSSEAGRYSAEVVLVRNVDNEMELLSVYIAYV